MIGQCSLVPTRTGCRENPQEYSGGFLLIHVHKYTKIPNETALKLHKTSFSKSRAICQVIINWLCVCPSVDRMRGRRKFRSGSVTVFCETVELASSMSTQYKTDSS